MSESSLKRWCDRGLIPTVRTVGGHRRLPLGGVLQFLRESGHSLAHPEILGLPPTTGQGARTVVRSRERLVEGLLQGNEALCRQIVFDLYLAEHSVAAICDEVISAAFREIGHQWDCGDAEVYQERRGCEIALRLMFELQMALPAVKLDAPVAIGCTPEGDPYSLPSNMVAMVLRDRGWNATNLGTNIPFTSIQSAISNARPALFWLSVSVIADREQFLSRYDQLYDEYASQVAFVVGGRALVDDVRQRMRYSAYCDTLEHLTSFVTTLTATQTA